ncbi:alanyl-tRNA editing protein [Roseomonas xinghualingensis]|uniref:alanyl-tRNA editing protein n=1 Tax=Roseomonas xinghualingensis TaxID=2986475 RepID=UPI0021F11622|nr:alanyl-tRNA editing protein [Roseomonas sp. SXEYE001]MCV4206742.1 alanyl-tRNA editing protein [Roseomonas sp. SXEYE001]
MQTTPLFRDDAYAEGNSAIVLEASEAGVILDRSVFYPRAGGQPGDTGTIIWEGGEMPVADTVKSPDGSALHVPAPGSGIPPVGAKVTAKLDWTRRHRHMRMHTTLHLLCAAMPGIYATGNQIGAEKSRLDFDLPEPPTKEWVTEKLNELIVADYPIGEQWIAEEELDANPGLVRTLSVQPPRGAGQIRLVRIGPEQEPVDLQPCGGTHVRRTGEIGRVEVTKMESKGKQNRRIHIVLAEDPK